MEFSWTGDAIKQLTDLDRPIQARIAEKMRWFSNQDNPLSFAEPIVGDHGLFRFRIGAYRIFISPEGTILVVLRIEKRSEAYR